MAIEGVYPYGAQADVLDALSVAMGHYATAKLNLLKVNMTPTPDLTLAQVAANAADYTGFATKTVTLWDAAAKDASGAVRIDGTPAQWLAGGTAVSNTIYGVYQTNSAGDKLQRVWQLPVPVTMGVDLLQAVQFTPRVFTGYAGDGGVSPYSEQKIVLDLLTAVMGYFDGSFVKLYRAPLVPSPGLTLATLTANEANYTGYAKQAVAAWQPAAKDPSGRMRSDGAGLQFMASGVVASCTVYGAYLVDATEMVLQQVWQLPVPVTMGTDLLQAVDFTPCLFSPI